MKNTLAENMLRFAPKNLGAKDIKTLKRLAEQAAQNPESTSLQYVPAYNTGGTLQSASEYITAPFNGGTTYWLKSGYAAAAPISNILNLVGGLNIQQNKMGGALSSIGDRIFITDLYFAGTKTDQETGKTIPNPSGATDSQSAGKAVGDKKYVGRACNIEASLVQAQLNKISAMLRGNQIAINTDVIKGVASLILSLNRIGVKYIDFSEKSKELTDASTTGEFTTLRLV